MRSLQSPVAPARSAHELHTETASLPQTPGAAQPARSPAQQHREATTTAWHGAERASVRLKSEQGTSAPEHAALRTWDTEDTRHLTASQGVPLRKDFRGGPGRAGPGPTDGRTYRRCQRVRNGSKRNRYRPRSDISDAALWPRPCYGGFHPLSPSGGHSSLWLSVKNGGLALSLHVPRWAWAWG